MRKTKYLIVLMTIFACVSAMGCNISARNQITAPEIKRGQGYVITIKDKTYLEVWQACVRAMTAELNLNKINQQKGVLIGGRPQWESDEAVGVFIDKPNTKQTAYKIEVVSFRESPAGKNWELIIADRILKVVNKGKAGLKTD